jgi:hypothetical protein
VPTFVHSAKSTLKVQQTYERQNREMGHVDISPVIKYDVSVPASSSAERPLLTFVDPATEQERTRKK